MASKVDNKCLGCGETVTGYYLKAPDLRIEDVFVGCGSCWHKQVFKGTNVFGKGSSTRIMSYEAIHHIKGN